MLIFKCIILYSKILVKVLLLVNLLDLYRVIVKNYV